MKDLDLTGIADMIFVQDDMLGRGQGRVVFPLRNWLQASDWIKTESDLVLKIAETSQGLRANVVEYEFWDDNKDFKPVAKWLAPIHHISDCGRYLIMTRTYKIPHDEVPKSLPEFFEDVHYDNLGLIDGRVVTHDYAFLKYTLPPKLVKHEHIYGSPK